MKYDPDLIITYDPQDFEKLSKISPVIVVPEGDIKTTELSALIVEALVRHAAGDEKQAAELLRVALAMAEPGGFIRIFIDEGEPMKRLLSIAHERGIKRAYVAKLLAAFGTAIPHTQPLIEPLSERELEVLRLVAQGLSNQEIGERLFLALSSVKGHNRNIFDKLQVSRRTEAVARGRELGLL